MTKKKNPTLEMHTCYHNCTECGDYFNHEVSQYDYCHEDKPCADCETFLLANPKMTQWVKRVVAHAISKIKLRID